MSQVQSDKRISFILQQVKHENEIWAVLNANLSIEVKWIEVTGLTEYFFLLHESWKLDSPLEGHII